MQETEKDKPRDKLLGIVLILVGVIGFIFTAAYSIIDMEKITNGTIPAVSFLVLVIGIAFYFPSLLEESKGEISTMRVIVLIVVLVFATVYIKLGWVAGSFEEFFIDTSWIYILGLAFGAKAFQKFAESDDTTKN
jgi:predicted MFS family arabinose efflux permease